MGMRLIGLGALFGFTGVAAGAFGAHGLKGRLPDDLMVVFELAARYQMLHAVALVVVGALAWQRPGRLVASSGWMMAIGIVIFSGSLYVLAMTGMRWLGAITPLGGTALLISWFVLAIWAFREKE